MKTLSTLAKAEKVKDAVQIVWLLEIDADSPDAASVTLYYGSRKYTLSTKTYLDFFTPNGLRLSWDRIRTGGGLASVATFQAAIRNETVESNVTDTYFLENDVMRLYLGFIAAGAEKSDAVQIAKSYIEDTPFDLRAWLLEGIDGTDKDFDGFPRDIVNLIDHPDAPYDAYGKPIPLVVGDMNIGPHDDAGASAFLAPCRPTDGFLREFTPGKRCKTYGTAYQYYDSAMRYAEVVNATQAAEVLTVTTARRKMRLYPVLPGAANDVANYPKVFDGDATTSVTVGAGANLDVFIGGVPKLGTIISALVQINSSAGDSYGYDILYSGSSIFANASASADTTIPLTDAATVHNDDWDFELYEVRIAGHANNPGLEQIYLEITYDDQMTADRQGLAISQKVVGWEDQTANYTDGAVINSAGVALATPPQALAAVLRGKALMELAFADVDSTAVGVAHTARSDWKFAFSEDKSVDDIEWLNRYCFTAGLHLFKSFEGKWKMVAMDKSRTPEHTFLENSHIAVRNPEARVQEWEPDITFGKTPVRDIINEVVLKYRKDRGTDEYSAIEIASGRHRVTGTCSTASATSQLTDASGDFITNGVAVGDTVYVVGDKDYTVTVRDNATTLTMTGVGGVNTNAAGTTYFLGPNLKGEMKRSQLRYKTTNPLGEETKDFRNIGGFGSDLIADAATAALFITHLEEWRSERRMTIEFATFLNAIDVELGDAVWFDHAWLPISKRPPSFGTTTTSETNASTGWASAENTLYRANDFVLVNDLEVVKVTSVSYSTTGMTVVRGQCNTTAIAHASGVSLKRLNMVKWEVTGLRVDVEKSQIRIELQEMPPSYKPTGRVVATGYPVYDSATAAQRAQSGWATKLSGRVEENDIYSSISWVGPDTGTY